MTRHGSCAVGAALMLAAVLTATGAPIAYAQEAPATTQASGKAHDATYIIGNSDVLAITVWKQPDISRSIPVRPDGRISLPLVGELQATGRTPLQLEQDITEKLKTYMTNPEVTVIVDQINSQKFNVLGRVAKPGSYLLTTTTTVLDAIASAGGFQDFAKQKGVYILRHTPDGGQTRIPFNYKDVIKGKHVEQNIRLQAGDTVIVP
jgi:polysaccharide biosynthesis/export protein